MKKIIFTLLFLMSTSAFAYGEHFDWGQGRDGWGYCYLWNNYGQVLNGGEAYDNYNCEQVHPSYYSWGRGQNGYTYCYQMTSYGVAMNQGRAVDNYFCERR